MKGTPDISRCISSCLALISYYCKPDSRYYFPNYKSLEFSKTFLFKIMLSSDKIAKFLSHTVAYFMLKFKDILIKLLY